MVGGWGFVVHMGFLLSAGRLRENGDSSRGVQTFAAGGVGESRGHVTSGGWFRGERDIGSSVWVCSSSAYTVQGQGLARLARGSAWPDPMRARVGPDFW